MRLAGIKRSETTLSDHARCESSVAGTTAKLDKRHRDAFSTKCKSTTMLDTATWVRQARGAILRCEIQFSHISKRAVLSVLRTHSDAYMQHMQ